jgi:hypothetical protein
MGGVVTGGIRRPLIGVLAACAIAVPLLVAEQPAVAAVFSPTPDPTVDGAAGSLRAAIIAATDGGGDEIALQAGGTYTLTCAGGGALSHGNTPLAITGNGATIVQTCPNNRVLGTQGSLALDGVTITGASGASGNGAGLFVNSPLSATLTISNSVITGNTSTDNNRSGGGIYTSALTNITNSTISDNHTLGTLSTGGGIYSAANLLAITDSVVTGNSGTSGGGIRNAAGTFTMTRTTVSGNDGGAGAGATGGGILAQGANANIFDSTISGNAAWGGAGFFRDGSGSGSSVNVIGSTVSGNIVGAGGGGGASSLVPMTLINSTVSGNTGTGVSANADEGPDPAMRLVYSTIVDNSDDGFANVAVVGNLETFGTVIAHPQGGGDNCVLINGTTTSHGFNYSDDSSCGLNGMGDTEDGAPPELGALAANGGPTLTRLPAAPGPLVDAIPTGTCGANIDLDVDQRGFPRPDPGGTMCDIGAVEIGQDEPPAPLPAEPGSDTVTVQPTLTG